MKVLTTILIALTLIFSAGCFGRGAPSHYYLMSAKDPLIRQAIEPTEVLGIGPVTIPEYLNREAIVIRKGDYELQISDLHRWAEPMLENILRVLKSYLEVKAPAYRIEAHPWGVGERPEKRIAFSISQFEQVAGERVVLKAAASSSGLIADANYNVEIPCQTLDKSAVAQCMSGALEELAAQISQNISP